MTYSVISIDSESFVFHMKKDKWQNKDDQNVKVAMAFKALIK